MYLLIFFLPMLLIYLRGRSVAVLLLSLIVFSLLGTTLLGRNDEIAISSVWDVFALFIPVFILLAITIPWRSYKQVENIVVPHPDKLKKLTTFLIIVNIFPFIIFSITAFFVQTIVENISQFKYVEGEALEFYSTMLPFNIRFFILCTLINGFAYFMIPLHFYYLSIKRYKLAIVCLILSFNIILHGATFFSRAVLVEYLLLYISMYWMLHRIINKRTKKILKYLLLIPVLIVVINMFIGITNDRFEETSYFDQYITKSPIKNTSLYSIFDYSSQWYFNGFKVLKDYDLETFQGKITFESLNNLLGKYGVTTYKAEDYLSQRERLWKENWFTFTGVTAYSIYDYGVFITLVLCVFYYLLVRKLTPYKGTMSINNLFLVTLIIQIPLMSIFYSKAGELLFPLLFYFVIKAYLRIRIF